MKHGKFGLIGHPISHSLSPALFKAGYGGKYTYDLIEGDDFDVAYNRFLEEYDAINVTAPFKELAIRHADECTAECKAIGAANILLKRDNKIIAANSDHLGVIKSVMAGLYPDKVINTLALVIGCGGAAKAAAYAMCCCGYQVVIINRNYEKARDFAQRLEENPQFKIQARPLEEFRKWFRMAGAVIYTLPVAIPALEDLNKRDIRGGLLTKKNKILVEANYKNPAFTPEMLMRMQKANPGLTYINGKEWLLHQAVGAFYAFTGEDPDLEQMRRTISDK